MTQKISRSQLITDIVNDEQLKQVIRNEILALTNSLDIPSSGKDERDKTLRQLHRFIKAVISNKYKNV